MIYYNVIARFGEDTTDEFIGGFKGLNGYYTAYDKAAEKARFLGYDVADDGKDTYYDKGIEEERIPGYSLQETKIVDVKILKGEVVLYAEDGMNYKIPIECMSSVG